ncbi:hypothetical protein [Aerophototrophica crusticola]|uniref:hypothetical protein n=1 Tax=Aerophototrophica crusticola TaxID=1709002 RepID=UPI0009514A74
MSTTTFRRFAAVLLLAAPLGLAACDSEGPAERAGEKIDNAAENAAEKTENAAEKLGDKIEAQAERAENNDAAARERLDSSDGKVDGSATSNPR